MELTDPFARFEGVYARACESTQAPYDPTAMTLATADARGRPSARVVLLKSFDRRGFVFFTNYMSRKGQELTVNPYAALCMHWAAIGEQVRVAGPVERVEEGESDAYFRTRPLQSQLGAWASEQSRPLSSREALMARVALLAAKYLLGPVPRPAHWGGYRLVAEEMEFWREGAFRLHDRFQYRRAGGVWQMERLSP
jgi:pyridoxamine 5'-phosphate oxidase